MTGQVVPPKDLVGDDYEIIFVNDGSPDSSLDKAIHLTQEHDSIKIIDLSRNFGHHKAMMTGARALLR
jgi:putative glycosyltransferase